MTNFCAIFEHGEIFSDYPLCVSYGFKHQNRFGKILDIREAADGDPVDEYRLTYRLFASSPARQRYMMRMHAKRNPGQSTLFDMFTPEGAKPQKLPKQRTSRGRKMPKAHI